MPSLIVLDETSKQIVINEIVAAYKELNIKPTTGKAYIYADEEEFGKCCAVGIMGKKLGKDPYVWAESKFGHIGCRSFTHGFDAKSDNIEQQITGIDKEYFDLGRRVRKEVEKIYGPLGYR